MTINTNNYEEFLLLSIDGELSIEMQNEVDIFLEQNPIIQQEFNLLLDSKLQLDNVSFGDVASLLKNENESIGLNNYEEIFLLYVDDELNNPEKKNVETYVLQHPTLQPEFITLKQTKLPAETIECPNKKELYKKRKTVVFYLQRMAVAAVFIGVVAFGWNIIGSNKNEKIVVKNGTKKVEPTILSNTNSTKELGNNSAVKTISIDNKKEGEIVVKRSSIINKKENIEIIKNNTPQPIQQQNIITTNITAVSNQPSINNDVAINQTTKPEIRNIVTTHQIANIETPNIKPQTVAVVYKTLDDDEENTTSKNQSKLKKLLNKASKLINTESNADNDSRKLFAVNL